jgi:acetolactate synthase-1/2/3 large subunit
MEIPVSELIVRYMERLGIKAIFGMPGAHILPVYDSLYNSPIHSVLAKHEQGAAFMAGGYSRTSGNISACITTAGPGATNLVTGIANAYADKLPVLCITGEAPTYIFGKGGLQESSGEGGAIDQIALFKSITVYQKLIERTIQEHYRVSEIDRAHRLSCERVKSNIQGIAIIGAWACLVECAIQCTKGISR